MYNVHNRLFYGNAGTVNYAACMLICQNAMLEVFPCFSCVDRKKKKIDRIAYSDASVIVIKSRKSEGYAIADTDCTVSLYTKFTVCDTILPWCRVTSEVCRKKNTRCTPMFQCAYRIGCTVCILGVPLRDQVQMCYVKSDPKCVSCALDLHGSGCP